MQTISKKNKKHYFYILPIILCTTIIAGCVLWNKTQRKTNFSQYPGFNAYFTRYPPAKIPPSHEEQKYIYQHRPRIFIPENHEGPISFYDDYIAHGILQVEGKSFKNPTQTLLNQYKDDPYAVFTHIPKHQKKPTPILFARIDRQTIRHNGEQIKLTFLTYHLVFRNSGLPNGMPLWQKIPIRIIANIYDWHQLDHYTAISVILAQNIPLAVMMQQHNYSRTYILNEYHQPNRKKERYAIDVAMQSNELFPHEKEKTYRRAVRFPTPDALRYLFGYGKKPILAAEDVTHPQQEIDYKLEFLAPNDAFYRFKGFLGERRKLPGRDGPPGADYNTLPKLKPPVMQMIAGYWRENYDPDRQTLEKALSSENYIEKFVSLQKGVLFNNLKCAIKMHSDPSKICNFK